jgi:hypothetical protein
MAYLRRKRRSSPHRGYRQLREHKKVTVINANNSGTNLLQSLPILVSEWYAIVLERPLVDLCE